MANQVKEYITDYEGDGQVIVLLHGFLASSAYWRRLQPRLSAEGYRVITIDLLGFGNAPKPTRKIYNYHEHVEHINNALNNFKLDRPFILAGHSMGALLAMRFARVYKASVASLILLHPPLYASAEQAYKALRSTGVLYRFLFDSKFRPAAWGILRLLPIFNKTLRHNKQSREGSLKNVIEVAEGFKDLKQLDTKTLLVVGSHDRQEYLNNVRRIKLAEAVKLKILSISHHSPLLKPSLIHQTISNFV